MAIAATKAKATKTMEAIPPSPIWVKWIDSMEHTGGWDSAQAYADMATYESMIHESIGFLIGENAYCVLITGSIQQESETVKDPNVGTVMVIPKVALLERKDLTIPATVAKRKAKPRRKSDTSRARASAARARLRPVPTVVTPFGEKKDAKKRAATPRRRYG